MTTRYWHPFADMRTVAAGELVIRSGDGAWVEDVDGRRYLDATGGLWYCSVGHGRAEIADAVREQMARLAAYSTFGPYATEPTLELAERLADLAPFEDAVVFFGSGGSDAVDTAAKLARRYWDAVGRPEKRVIVSRQHGYHGMHAYGTSLAGIAGNREGYGGALIDEVEVVPHDDVDALETVLGKRGHEVAAVIGEPVIGAGGVYPPADGYWEAVSQLCAQLDVLLIADEVITGFGRVGTMWGSQRFAARPDIVIFAKGVTSGYLPLGGILVGSRIREVFWEGPAGGPSFRHGYTYSGHAAACAAALANLDIIEREGLVARVAELEPTFAAAARKLAELPTVGEVRTVGLLAAVALSNEVMAADPGAAERAALQARQNGVLTRVVGGRALQVSPAFVISEAEIGQLFDALATSVNGGA